MIKISVKGLAKFMTATDGGKRKVLRDFKYPDVEGLPQALYYREATEIIQTHHKTGATPDWLLARATDLTTMAQTLSGAAAARRQHNARALRDYAANWGHRKLVWVGQPRAEYQHAGVRVTIVPDLHVSDAGHDRYIKLDFSPKEPNQQVPKIVSQAMFEALVAAGRQCRPADVLYFEVARNRVTRGARAGARLLTEMHAACENIAAIWERI